MTGRPRRAATSPLLAGAWVKAGRMLENDQFLPAVLDLCRTLHLRTAHFRPMQDSRGQWRTPVAGDGKGFPDLVIVGPGGVLWRELKTERGTLTAEQKVWVAALTAAGQNVAVWQPHHLADGTIPRELGALRHQQPTVALPGL